MKKNTMFGKSICMFLTVFLVLIIAFSNISLYFIFHKVAINNELEQLSSKSELIAEGLINSKNNEAINDELLRISAPTNGMIRVVGEGPNSILTVVTSENGNLLDSKPTFKEVKSSEIKTIAGVQYAVTYNPIIWSDGKIVTLELIRSLEPLQKNIAILKPILTGVSLILTLSIISFILLVKRDTRRITVNK